MEKPRLSFWQIWNMSFGFLGIQFGWGLQMANMSAIYQYLGARENEIPILWLAAPSHRPRSCSRSSGTSRTAPGTGSGAGGPTSWAAPSRRASRSSPCPTRARSGWRPGLLWILDASVNVSMEPFRAFVGDMLPNEQRKSGFAMQSLLIGAGAVLSSALPYILTHGFGVSGESTVESAIPPTVHVAFTIGAFVFFLAVLYTVLTTREYPPEDLAAFEKAKRETAGLSHAFREIFQGIGSMPGPMRKLAAVQFFTWFGLFCLWIYFAPGVAKGIFRGAPLGAANATVDRTLDEPSNAPLLDAAARAARAYEELKRQVASAAPAAGEPRGGAMDGVLTMLGLKAAPPDPGARITAAESRLRPRAVARRGRRARVGRRPPEPDGADRRLAARPERPRPRRGRGPGRARGGLGGARRAARLGPPLPGGRLLGRRVLRRLQPGGLRLLLPPPRARQARERPRSIHLACLALGGLGLLSVLVVRDPTLLLVSMVGVGVAWASILAMPYAMLSNALPAAKMGFYMGVFNFFIVLPQILASVGLGWVMERFLGNDATKALLLGGASMLLAALLVLRVKKEETE